MFKSNLTSEFDKYYSGIKRKGFSIGSQIQVYIEQGHNKLWSLNATFKTNDPYLGDVSGNVGIHLKPRFIMPSDALNALTLEVCKLKEKSKSFRIYRSLYFKTPELAICYDKSRSNGLVDDAWINTALHDLDTSDRCQVIEIYKVGGWYAMTDFEYEEFDILSDSFI